MGDYVLQVNYAEDEEPLRLVLHGYDPDAAETAHKALEAEIEHARTLNAPVVFSAGSDRDPVAGTPIDPARVTGVDLVAPEPDEA